MPIVRIDIIQGRPAEVKADLIRKVTSAVVESLGVQPGQVRVLLYELPAAHWAVGGEQIASPQRHGEQKDSDG